jgi:hypothetical protein
MSACADFVLPQVMKTNGRPSPIQMDAAGGPKVTVLRSVAGIRFRDGQALLRTGNPERFAAAIYLAGYGLECALKVGICEDRQFVRLPRDFWDHDLLALARETRTWSVFATDRQRPNRLLVLAGVWSVSMRYDLRQYHHRDVHNFIVQAKDLSKEFASCP